MLVITNDGILKGTVKWFNDLKGFGFIRHESGKDVFVHFSVIEDQGFKTLNTGEEVEYELIVGKKGLYANKVRRIAKKDYSAGILKLNSEIEKETIAETEN